MSRAANIELATRRIDAAVSASWQAGAARLNVRNMASALSMGGVEAVRPAVEQAAGVAMEQLRKSLPRIVRAVVREAATSELQHLRRGVSSLQDEETFPDLTDPDDSGDLPIVSDLDLAEIGFDAAGETIVEEQIEELADELGTSMTEALLLLLAFGLAAGIAPLALAQRLRTGLGLRPDQVRAVGNLARELATARPGSLVVRFRARPGVRSRDGFRVRIPTGGASAGWIEQQLARYVAMHRNDRARLIARTLAVTAWERGRALLWELALRSGILPPGTVRRWVTAGDARVCPRCRAMEGQLIVVGAPFESPDVGLIQGPPLHARCRCTAVLVTNRNLKSNRKETTMLEKVNRLFRTATATAGEGELETAWRAANQAPVESKAPPSKATKTPPAKPQNHVPPDAREVLTRLRQLSPEQTAALYDSVRREHQASFEPPDPYLGALEQRRAEYHDDNRPTTYEEVNA